MTTANETIGKLDPPGTLFLRQSIGDATDDEGNVYEMTLGAGTSCPVVRSKRTGNWFSLSWQDILNLAREAGIDEQPAAAEVAS